MFDYLVNYGIKKYQINHDDLDINDRLMLQEQINKVRKNYSSLLNLLDDVQERYLNVSKKLTNRSKEIIESSNGARVNNIYSSDDEYISLEAEQQALKTGMQMINAQIDFCKNDLRILNSVFYNKF